MPVCFQLFKKSDPKTPVVFALVDDEICAHLGVEPDKNLYHAGWYDTVGLLIACGKTFTEIRVAFAESPRLIQIVDFLEANYNTDSWREFKS